MATADVPPKRLRMAAVDDHPIVVEGLVSLLTRGPEGSRARPDTPAVEWLGQTRTFAELRARIDAQAAEMPKPMWPALLEGPVRIDVPINAPWKEGQELVYWAN